jgi:hypothetical protein
LEKLQTLILGLISGAYLHDSGMGLSKPGYTNTVLVLTDGYFDLEVKHMLSNKRNQCLPALSFSK